MSPGIYPSCLLNGSQIRVLTIHPNDWSAAVDCELNTVSLSSKPRFAALSYVWGAQYPNGCIRINGQEVKVGRSLETALRYYRQADWDMPIWADAVCINQSDNVERSAQVNIMDAIYSSAAGVFIFLGSGFDLGVNDWVSKIESLRDFQFMAYGKSWTSDAVGPNWEGNRVSNVPNRKSSLLFHFLEGAAKLKINDHLDKVHIWGMELGPMLESEYPWDDFINAFEAFTMASWWSRAWTVQESVVGVEPILVYGTAAIPWSLIREAAETMDIHVAECCNKYLTNDAPQRFASILRRFIYQVDSIERARSAFPKDDSSLSHALEIKTQFSLSPQTKIDETLPMRLLHKYLWLYHERTATDPRDKIYSLLSLAKMSGLPLKIYPDYATKKEDTYINAARKIIESMESLDVLRAASV